MPFWRLYYHIVWATWRRAPFITPEVEPTIHRIIGSKAILEKAHVYALNGMADHIHLVVTIPPSHKVSSLMHRVKGASSHFISERYGKAFKWQKGYGVLTVGPSGLETAVAYVQNQKQHHADGTIINALEYFTADDIGPQLATLSFDPPSE